MTDMKTGMSKFKEVHREIYDEDEYRYDREP